MLLKSCWTIKQEIQKLTALRTPSPRITSVCESPVSRTRPTPISWLSTLPPLFFHSGATEPFTGRYYCSAAKHERDPRREGDIGSLPSQLARWVAHLTCPSPVEGGTCNVYVVGTQHDTELSGQEVDRVIDYVKPRLTLLELCENRRSVLEDPKSEFYVANEAATKIGCKVVLRDRSILVTYRRILQKVPLSKWRDVFIYRRITKQWPFKEFPQIFEPFINERDTFMVSELGKYTGKYNPIVAVVGCRHLHGIESRWKWLWRNVHRTPFKMFPFERRQADYARLREKWPDRIPVIIERAEGTDVPPIVERKFAIRADLTVGQFANGLRKKIDPSPEKAIFVFVKNSLLPTTTTAMMSAIYEKNKDEDGFLYVTYSGENTSGAL